MENKFQKHCTGCTNLITMEFLGKDILCCGGNVNYPEICVLSKSKGEKVTMTENKTIIDGIDVNKCSHLELDCNEFYCDVYGRNVYCNSNPNCYFKQLARKTQECENNKIIYQNELDILNQECSSLLHQLQKALDELSYKTQEYDILSSRHSELVSESNQLRTERNRYKKKYRKNRIARKQAEQKLKRIKDIANNYDNSNDVGHYVQDTEARHALEEVTQAMLDISQIIDEVQNG